MIRLRRTVLFLLGITPFIYIGQAIVRLQLGEWEMLGPEPGKAVVWFTGTWAFNFLLLTLAVTPLRRLLKQPWLLQHMHQNIQLMTHVNVGLWSRTLLTRIQNQVESKSTEYSQDP